MNFLNCLTVLREVIYVQIQGVQIWQNNAMKDVEFKMNVCKMILPL